MIKNVYRSICSILLVYFVVACGDKFSNFELTDQTIDSEIVAQAKRFYETETSGANLRTSESGKTPKKLEPQWKKAKEIVRENGDTIVFVPAENFKLNSKDLNLIRFFSFKKENNTIIDGQINEIWGNADFVNGEGDKFARKSKSNSIADFKGVTFEYDLNYKHKNGAFYSNGEKQNAEAKLAVVAVPQQGAESGRVASTLRTQNEGGCSTYYLVTYWSDGTTTWSYLSSSCGLPPTAPPGGPGTVTTNTPTNYDIKNDLVKNCFKTTFNTMLNNQITNSINSILTNFNKSNQMNFTIGEYNQADGRLAKTIGTEVYINLNTMGNASREFVAAVMYHEILHVYLGSTNWESHEKMSRDYVGPLKNLLIAQFGMNENDATALAWTGLGGSIAWTQQTQINSTVTNGYIDKQNFYKSNGGNCP